MNSFYKFPGAVEYCQFETFVATCEDVEINYDDKSFEQLILIDSARYGRMHTGRCVSKDYGYLGCSDDVTTLLDALCSGRSSCSFPVPWLREIIHPCPKDLISYLNVTYHCISGEISSRL